MYASSFSQFIGPTHLWNPHINCEGLYSYTCYMVYLFIIEDKMASKPIIILQYEFYNYATHIVRKIIHISYVKCTRYLLEVRTILMRDLEVI